MNKSVAKSRAEIIEDYPNDKYGPSCLLLGFTQAGRLVIIENVPAKVCLETGERFFSPETVEHLQQIIWEKQEPKRMVEAPVFEFAQKTTRKP